MSAALRRIVRALLACALVSAACAAPAMPSAPSVPSVPAEAWQTRLPAFSVDGPPRAAAPILLYFTAPWCGFCKQMERTTLADAEVRAQVARLRAHKIEFDEQRGLVERFGVRGIPAFVLTNDRGEVVDRLTGAVAKEVFLKWLAAGEVEARRRSQNASERARSLKGTVVELSSGEEAVRGRAVATFWELAGRGDEFEKKAASEALASVISDAKTSPNVRRAIWRAGLAHSDLAVRVAAANFLRDASPGASTAKLYDPWAEEATRTQAVEQVLAGL
jgi:thioredoxin-like negative regulator of GroEL